MKTSQPFEHARTELLFGEWLRRKNRRFDARNRLRSALDIFKRLDAIPWADRARSELRVAGQSQAPEDKVTLLSDLLTPQELAIARLAATGMSNRDIGGRLFLSPRTVAYHLYKANSARGVERFPPMPVSGSRFGLVDHAA